MEFHTWQSMIDEFKSTHRSDLKKNKLSIDEIYEQELENIAQSHFSSEANRWKRFLRLNSEQVWFHHGKPYYNVHPQLVRSLCKTNLNKIPADLIEMPHGFTSVCFRFAEDVPIQYVGNTGYTVSKSDKFELSPIYCRSVLFSKVKIPESEEEQFIFILDEGFRNKYEINDKHETIDRTLCNTITFSAKPGQTIPEAIKHTVDTMTNEKERHVMVKMGERLSNLCRIIISSGFLANTIDENLVVPDILANDRSAYKEAVKHKDQEKIKTIVERAKRRGKFGYNIGTNEMFVAESREARYSNVNEGTGEELEYSHLRGGHPHAVRYGEGKKKVKIKWFRPMRVRPDLPFKADTD